MCAFDRLVRMFLLPARPWLVQLPVSDPKDEDDPAIVVGNCACEKDCGFFLTLVEIRRENLAGAIFLDGDDGQGGPLSLSSFPPWLACGARGDEDEDDEGGGEVAIVDCLAWGRNCEGCFAASLRL